jgi:endonuclease-3 related protein
LRAEEAVRQIYRTLSRAWGRQHWWPAESPFEVIVGAILTQNTSWSNVERALAKLRETGTLHAKGIRNLSNSELEQLVRSSGYFRQKAQRLKAIVSFVDDHYGGSLEAMFEAPVAELRSQLLGVNGIGHETADSILLYAGLQPVFVVDAYTRRIFERHRIVSPTAKYDDIRELVEHALENEEAPPLEASKVTGRRLEVHAPSAMSMAQQSSTAGVYNEMHGLLVQVGKHYCSKESPKCESCPLGQMLSVKQLRALKSCGASRIGEGGS